jgi:Raf kinase inhibitor-like YbhB/YbcL family protein
MRLLIFSLCLFLGLHTETYGAEGFLNFSSPAFQDQEIIPLKYTCKDKNLSPGFKWSTPPIGTKSFAITCQDPDAPHGTFIHWIIYNIPTDLSGIAEGIEKKEVLTDGSRQGTNSFNRIGYDGPCPPPRQTHHYIFTLYALDSNILLPPGSTFQEFEKAAKGHVLQMSEWIGLFRSP